MLRSLPAFVALVLAVSAIAQSPQAVTSQSNTLQPPASAMLRANARLVVVDVVVQDKRHNPVHDLKAEDFSLQEGGTAQAFKSFEEHRADVATGAMPQPPMPKLPPGIFTNFTPTTTSGPLNILLLDRMNTAIEDQAQMQSQINAYLASMKPGMRMAIFGLTDHLIMLQGFTSDPALLRAAIVKGGYFTSQLRKENVGGEGNAETISPAESAAIGAAAAGATPTEAQAMAAAARSFEALQAPIRTEMRIRTTLDALNALATALAAYPGRKNLVWFSGSFPINVMPDINKSGFGSSKAGGAPAGVSSWADNPFAGMVDMQREFFETAALFSRNQVAVYPIDASGLTDGTQEYSAATISTSTGLSGRQAKGQTTLEEDINTSSEKRNENHTTMYALADATGGKAAVDTNGLQQAIDNALADGANYYTITYSPISTDWNGEFRRIEVKLKERGYNLTYRKGYYASDPDVAPRQKIMANATATHAMVLAMMHGAPTPTQIVFTTRVLPAAAGDEAALAADNKAGKGLKPPYQRYSVEFAVSPEQIKFTQTSDDHRHAPLEFVAGVYDMDGKLMNSISKSIQADIIPAAYAQFMQNGIPYRLQVSVPANGDYSLRLAVHDANTDRVGALELPVASVRHLAPLDASITK